MTTTPLTSRDPANRWLWKALGLSEENTPFPWQEELLARFTNGVIERALDIPTGLGKTAVMAIWLVARAQGAPVPRRLVYVVDRRAIVDQATDVAEGLRKCVDDVLDLKESLGLGTRSLPISTLRGQHVDNREWLEDPASPAIVVGTVDMIGSRLLFEGYGTSRKMRPYHAGLLGADTLVVLDEAHLVPPFEKLLETMAEGSALFGPRAESLRTLIPPFKLLSLSATGREPSGRKPFGLQEADLKHPVVRRRLDAPKRVTVHPLDDQTKLENALATRAWQLTDNGQHALRVIVFCDKREVAKATKAAVEKLAKGDKAQNVPEAKVDNELFVGGRRVLEREAAAQWLKRQGFIAGSKVERTRSAFVFATSAGEVGVDLDADHMVSDLVAWERMVQRLGRVNRRGDGKADVVVVVEPTPKRNKFVEDALAKDSDQRGEKERKAVAIHEASIAKLRAWAQPLDHLRRKDGDADASPGTIRALRLSAEENAELQAVLDNATTPAPLRPALSRALVDAWSMTSLKEHTGRPEIDPWLRGWIDHDPQTALVWRTHLPVRPKGRVKKKEIEAFFEAAPPHLSEMLETETFRVVVWLAARAKRLRQASSPPESGAGGTDRAPLQPDDVLAIALTPAGDLRHTLQLKDIDLDDVGDARIKKEQRESLESFLMGATLVLDVRLRGLDADGLLDADCEELPRTADDGSPWISASATDTKETSVPVVRFRVRTAAAGQPVAMDPQWRERHKFATELSEDGEQTRWLIVDKWRHDAATEEDRSSGRPQLLAQHQAWAEQRARDLAHRLLLPDAYAEMLAIAARVHDEGKQAKRWQQAFNARTDGVYAKTRGPLNVALLDGYRHEFGSLLRSEKDTRLSELTEDHRDLALHLIAAHHGFARPIIGTGGCEDAPPSALEERAREIALRFARLQKRWGPWGLAWWESLLRAVDQQASRDNEAAALAEENI